MDQERNRHQAALASLNDGQREALRLVFLHMSSKDIGRELKVSSHTIDNRVKAAMQKLGASNRWEAARILAEDEGAIDPDKDYRRLVDQPPVVDEAPVPPPIPFPAGHVGRLEQEGAGERNFRDAAVSIGPELGRWSTSQVLPLPHRQGEPNRMTPMARIASILGIALAGIIAFGALVSAVQSLGQLL
ncbi:sigma factor-like helix-turn-helix DNA-binding protein [Pacificimonas sp. ICDLI1SI03]|jgi:DNA-binding CsgD family transcriptional regulator|tara:strand:- start:26517 stop:27080 length:564 start_codon:yes stop_codon:yes gene_type:complete